MRHESIFSLVTYVNNDIMAVFHSLVYHRALFPIIHRLVETLSFH